MTDNTFKTDRKLTNTNPQQKDYYWAGTELITYENKNGVTLQGSLMYPANYEAGKKYPMIVWIYEKLSQGLHDYTLASNRSAYNKRVWSSMGFFYYEPDIVYRIGEPGLSAVECVVPAVEAVIKKGVVDPQKIGLMGHSWGAYQTAFIITQTNLFSAAVAGAPLINMISMYSSVYWNTGSTNQVIFETSQGRLPNPYWEDWDAYVRNSPLFNAQNINTPFLVAFGDNDGAVDWNQGVEMYNAMRRRQKEFVMLVYDGENHSLSKKEDQIDYAKRVQDWFKHYLLGEPAEDWIAKGVPYNERPAAKKAAAQPPSTGGAPVIIR
jgi:dipeptidyl aminopeptidase/acylaminoacyl peptidase